jgi:uncharacterized caspase-like protein
MTQRHNPRPGLCWAARAAGALMSACLILLAAAGAARAGERDIRVNAGPSQSRIALVIGNATYAASPLKNPVNDARDMARTLRSVGFDVVEATNATKAQMENAVVTFGRKLTAGSVALVYYSGHGIQVSGKNYLIPVDAEIESEQAVALRTVDADAVINQMMAARTRVNLLILDACRNNPFERRFRAGTGNGLAQMNAPEGTLVAYATAPGRVASDGVGTNGLYTQELLKALAEPGLPVEQVFKRVRATVSQASQGNQVPWESSSLIGEFYFKDGPPNAQAVLPVVTPQVAPPAPAPVARPQSQPDVPRESVTRPIPRPF